MWELKFNLVTITSDHTKTIHSQKTFYKFKSFYKHIYIKINVHILLTPRPLFVGEMAHSASELQDLPKATGNLPSRHLENYIFLILKFSWHGSPAHPVLRRPS